jgi:hypothetical protein
MHVRGGACNTVVACDVARVHACSVWLSKQLLAGSGSPDFEGRRVATVGLSRSVVAMAWQDLLMPGAGNRKCTARDRHSDCALATS